MQVFLKRERLGIEYLPGKDNIFIKRVGVMQTTGHDPSVTNNDRQLLLHNLRILVLLNSQIYLMFNLTKVSSRY